MRYDEKLPSIMGISTKKWVMKNITRRTRKSFISRITSSVLIILMFLYFDYATIIA